MGSACRSSLDDIAPSHKQRETIHHVEFRGASKIKKPVGAVPTGLMAHDFSVVTYRYSSSFVVPETRVPSPEPRYLIVTFT
jgi:hypothetical protein